MQDHQGYNYGTIRRSDSIKDLPSAFTCDADDLRIVLLGVSGAGKSSIGNAILGQQVFEESVRESEIQRGRVEDRNISIIDTPGFFNNDLDDEELHKQMMKSLDLSDPGPHMFLLIVNLKNFEKYTRNIVEKIEDIFGAQALKFTMVLFIGREKMPNNNWQNFILSEGFKGLVKNFREQYHEMNSKIENDQTHIKKLLKKIEFIKQNEHYNSKICLFKKKEEEEKQEKERQAQALPETFRSEPENVRQRKKATDEEPSLQRRSLLNRGQTFSSQEKQNEDKSRKTSQKKQQTKEEEHPTQAVVAAAPPAPPLPAEQQLDLVTRIKDKLKKKCRGRCLVLLMTVCLVLICVPLLAFIIHQHITIKGQKDQLNSCNNKIEEFNQIINSLQEHFTELTTEKDMWYQFTKRIGMANSDDIIKSYSLDMTFPHIFFHS